MGNAQRGLVGRSFWRTCIKGMECVDARRGASGRILGYVQGTGKEPKDGQPVGYDSKPDFEDFAIGCYLLAGAR